ncbi:MAG: sigma-70 family RNA polymerase sigma factor [Planctomycetota bacterium]
MEKPEELLAHVDFIQRLARRLIIDSHRAEDLAQDLWVAYLENPPNPRISLRAWLSGTLLNISRMMFRRSRRRERRERLYADMQEKVHYKTTGQRSVGQEIEDQEILRQVVDALLDLREPFRSTLLMRFYKDLSYKEVAHKLNIPLDTMKYRLKRGLALMQDQLDNRYKGDRSKWTASLLPFSGLLFTDSAQGRAPGAGSAGKGVLSLEREKIRHSLLSDEARRCRTVKKRSRLLHGWKPLVGMAGLCLLAWIGWLCRSDSRETLYSPEAEKVAVQPGWELVTSSLPAEHLGRDPLTPTSVTLPQAENQVAWEGTLRDFTGIPLADAVIGLKRLDCKQKSAFPLYTARTDLYGRFRMANLPEGDYSAYLNFQRTQHYGTDEEAMFNCVFIPWGTKSIDKKVGSHQDLQVLSESNAVVCVKVIDAQTALPVYREDVRVRLYNHPMCNTYFETSVNPENGTACFRCVPPDTYFVLLYWPTGYNTRHERHIQVFGGEVKNDIQMIVPPLGKLCLRLNGFTEEERAEVKVRCTALLSRMQKFENLEPMTLIEFEEGPLRVEVRSEKRGILTRTVDMTHGEEKELTVYPADLSTEEQSSLEIHGQVLRPDGVPMEHVWIHQADCRYGLMTGSHHIDFSHDEGRFQVKDCKPGVYAFCLYFMHPEDRESMILTRKPCTTPHPRTAVSLKDIEIPAAPSLRHDLKLIVPYGKVVGTLHDGSDGLPIHEKVSEWTITLNRIKRESTVVSKFFGRGLSNEFDLPGVPEGRYYLAVDCYNYFHYKSDLFFVREGETVDLEKVILEPSGIFDLEVFHKDGSPVSGYEVYYNGRILGQGGGSKRYKIAGPNSVRRRYSNLPAGPGTLEVEREGYRTVELPLHLIAGVPQSLHVTMEPDPESMDEPPDMPVDSGSGTGESRKKNAR